MTAPLQSRTCERCATEWKSSLHERLCGDCQSADAFARLAAEDREATDAHIYGRQSLAAILKIKESTTLTLGDATFLFHWRAQQLRLQHPERFSDYQPE